MRSPTGGNSHPYARCSESFHAAPMPRIARPREITSSVVTIFASIAGLRYVTPVTSVASRILTSAIKKTDVGVYNTVVGAAKGKFKGGKDLVFNLKNNGVGYGRLSPTLPAATRAAITKSTNNLEKQIIAGKVKPPKQ